MDLKEVERKIENSPKEIQDLLFSEEIGQFLQKLAEDNDLNEETSLNMIDEVGYVILGLKERSSLKNSFLKIGIPIGAVMSIIQEVSKKIFIELDKIVLKEPEKKEVAEETPPVITEAVEAPPSNLPMVEPGEVVHDVPHVEEPLNAPVSSAPAEPPIPAQPEVTKAEPSKPVFEPPKSHYSSGQDPYREPLV